ncbi:carbon-nitrogen hydrolase [Campylobacter novaezeelandiae]|uniref:N-carbamoylputrescine amidohydrolase n=1 Tax=Campylobacter novaezeelandiae TaxID=2267891 RepID=UPI00103782C8|nr:N-carbamoylputrescine amidohydrolase [Campylobacter novaezeelandiae]MBK1963672.1 N-carbamoylputrescine amidohydrolase [Campylobacter novaezeelandiae]MBK1993545.1 N-carbamoylputrescine amidohydrolase [Campylobacter novaezeelandiae]QWU80010.1 N-carbamoylputrescine amidohydrolase [Campylobacter novaezeelandiae]TBR79071.1 carbon-nitrogen hydrolase [Campylobacter novaezeelandiae]TBR81669.1 carbon-nitrogen hydrolase [Campylobacter novaezeelandiae]
MKIALIQQKFHQNKQATIEKTCDLIKKSAKEGAQLVCLCELHQGEYFCQSENVDFFDLANDYEKDLEFWSKVAKENNIVLITSLFEKRSAGLYHNTAVVFEKNGSIAGKYRKMHIPDDPCFYEKFYFTPGDLGFEPINTSIGKLGVLICWDQWYPEAARLMALKGAQILIYPTAIGWFNKDDAEEKQRQLDAWIGIQKGHAIANGLYVVAINRVGFEKDKSGVEEGINFWGNSFVIGPQGEELFRADETSELYKVVDIDQKRSENVRRWWPFLRDRRIEYFSELSKRFID